MTGFTHHLFGVVGAADRAQAEAVATAAGYGFGTFGSASSATGAEPATHWVFCTVARPAEIVRIRAGMPAGVTLDDAPRADWPEPGAFFRARLAAHGLKLIQPEV